MEVVFRADGYWIYLAGVVRDGKPAWSLTTDSGRGTPIGAWRLAKRFWREIAGDPA
jgi:hypothetical protein